MIGQESAHLLVYTDAMFLDTGVLSHLRTSALLGDTYGNALIIVVCYQKSRREVEFIMKAELYAFTNAFDISLSDC